MNIFISWSGKKSHDIAELFKSWLPRVIQSVKPWLSGEMEKGSIWFGKIGEALKDTTFGIICLTKDNIDNPWILFEAGALHRGLPENNVCTFLADMSPTDVSDPLAQFNHTEFNKDSIYKLIDTINIKNENRLDKEILEEAFQLRWPEFEKSINAINSKNYKESVEKFSKKNINDYIEEILLLVRNIDKKVNANNYEQDVYFPIYDIDKARRWR